MVFSYNWLQSFFEKKLPRPEKLAELLTMHSFEVKEVKKNDPDFILDIDVLPNRGPDCFSHLGIAREIAVITGFKYTKLNFQIEEDKEIKAKDFIKVEVKNKNACPRYTARVIIDVKVFSSPRWIKDKLKVCGLKPINNIVDIVNYVMLETGQPLHAFDGEKLEGKQILVRFAKKPTVRTPGEKIITLDEEKYDLDEDILVIADAKKPVAIAGIKGGKAPEINEKTKIVVLESANFNPQTIRRASKKIDLKTDASWRFEHGIDPTLTEFAINRAAYLIRKIAKGKIIQGIIDSYSKKVLPKKIKLDLDYLKNLLGIEISKKEIINILKKLEFEATETRSLSKINQIMVEVPTFRLDINLPEDLIEEIGRIYGYQKIPSVLPVVALIPPKRNLDIFWEDFSKNILKETGFNEVYNYSFISEKDKDVFGNRNLIEIENPVSLDFRYLRPSLIPNLLKNIQKNQKNFQEIKIFELGKIFRKINGKLEEKRMLSGVMSGESFYQLKGVIDALLNKLGISNIWYDSWKPTPEESKTSIWQLKKSAEIKINQEEIGFLGEISQKICKEMRIPKMIVFDIDFEKLSKLASEEHEYRPISSYPAAIRDISILVPQDTLVEEVLNKIETVGKSLIRDIDLFDIYEGEEIPTGKKNFAFHLIYQSDERTLTSQEIDDIQKKVIEALEKEEGWEVRK